MRRCRTCGEEYSLWNAGGDGLCPPCRSQQHQQQKTKAAEEALHRIHSWVSEIARREPVEEFALARWSAGSTLGDTARLWAGRAVFGMLADILHQEPHPIGLVWVSKAGRMHARQIADGVTITPDVIPSAFPEEGAVLLDWDLSEVSVSVEGNAASLWNHREERLVALAFPECFLEGNELFPEKLESLSEKYGEETVPELSALPPPSSELEAVWRTKADGEIEEALESLRDFKAEAQAAIRLEAERRGLDR